MAKRRTTSKHKNVLQLPDLNAFKQLLSSRKLLVSYLLLCSSNKAGIMNSVAQKSTERGTVVPKSPIFVTEHNHKHSKTKTTLQKNSLIYTFHLAKTAQLLQIMAQTYLKRELKIHFFEIELCLHFC